MCPKCILQKGSKHVCSKFSTHNNVKSPIIHNFNDNQQLLFASSILKRHVKSNEKINDKNVLLQLPTTGGKKRQIVERPEMKDIS